MEVMLTISFGALVFGLCLTAFLSSNEFRELRVVVHENKRSIEATPSHKDIGEKIDSTIAECEACGRLVYKKKSNGGTPEVRTRRKMVGFYASSHWVSEDYIYYPYYCKECKPKDKKNKKEDK